MTYTRGQNGQIEAKFNNSNRQNVQNAQYVFKETECSCKYDLQLTECPEFS